MENVNLWPIIMGAIITFGLSSLWYGPFVFGKIWIKLTNQSHEKFVSKKSIYSSYIVHLIFSLISCTILYFTIITLNIDSSLGSIFVGFIIWLAFMMPINLSYFLWHRNSFKLFLIDTSINLINIVVASLIFANWL